MNIEKLKTGRFKGKWKYTFQYNNHKYRKSGFATRIDAHNAAETKRLKLLHQEQGIAAAEPSKVTVAAVCAKRIAHLNATPKDARGHNSRKNAVVNINMFLGILPKNLKVTELRSGHLANYKDMRMKSVKPQTVERELSNIVSAIKTVHEVSDDFDSWRCPRRPKIEYMRDARTAVITPEQAALILRDMRRPKEDFEQNVEYAARLWMADFFQMALQTSKRRGELRTRRWSDINWHFGTLRVEATKTNKAGVIRLPATLIEMLKRRRAGQSPPAEYIFPSRTRPSKPMSRVWLSPLRKACRRVGLHWGYDRPDGIVLHTTRHSAVTVMLETVGDFAAAQEQTGHSSRTMLMRYGHATPQAVRKTVDSLNQFSGDLEVRKESADPRQMRQMRQPHKKSKAS